MQFDYLRPVFYLVRWRFYEEARYQLNEKELKDAKVFFNGMQQLTEEEKQLLSDVYRNSPKQLKFDSKRELYMTVQPVKDTVLSRKYGISVNSFANRRRQAQDHLKVAMQGILREIEDVFMFRAKPELYLIERIIANGNEQYLLGNQPQAKIFHAGDVELSEQFSLNRLGFEKVPVMPHQLCK